jgi:hypothetical protein
MLSWFVALLPGICLVVNLLQSAMADPSIPFANHVGLLTQFIAYRNLVYGVYAAMLIASSIFLVLRRSIEDLRGSGIVSFFGSLIPGIISGLVLTTFSYAVAAFLYELLRFFIEVKLLPS